MNGQSISDITFLDSLNGYAVTNLHYILKTTNGGDNWNIIYNDTTGNIFKRVIFLNPNIGFVGGSIISNSLYYILKTTNGGINWFYINAPFQSTYQADMSILNENTIWTVEDESLTGGVFLTTNGGLNWNRQLALGNQNPTNIYFYNKNIGFISKNTGSSYVRKTTDGGQSWDTIVNGEGFTDLYFIDSLTGWKADNGTMKKTTNGGLNWINQQFPITVASGIIKFSNVNNDTIWGVGGIVSFPNNQLRGIIYNTTNGGDTWRYQIPDTNINIFEYFHNKFSNRLVGWAYATQRGVHTVTGGNDTFYTSIKQISEDVPDGFRLFQNYPNPFNPISKIKYQISKISNVKLEVFDVSGRLINTLVNQKQNPGEYIVKLDASNLSSGVYFYRIQITDEKGGVIYLETKKAILVK
jgi:photosystem II stability/assembly factor-like uncharacterized protein